MFRIRRVYDDALPEDRGAVEQVQEILRRQFPQADPEDAASLPAKLRDPMQYRFRPLLFVADDGRGHVRGFALVLHAPDLKFCYLDYVSAAEKRTGGGIGGSLYDRVRQEARDLACVGVFLESLSDDPEVCADASLLKQNARRMHFYERYGARPIVNTRYETPLREDDPCVPSLVFDDLGGSRPLPRKQALDIVRAILERKYGDACSPEYIALVLSSFRDDPVKLRGPHHVRPEPASVPPRRLPSVEQRIALTVNDRHDIHHVRERGYVESPARISAILKRLEPTGLFDRLEPKHYGDKHLLAVHDRDFAEYLKRVCANVPSDRSVYPYVFPIRNAARPPKELPVRAGYYCIDTFTPLNQNAYLAARRAVDCTLTSAEALLHGHRLAYALVRPPGHHAEPRSFGGFCYFNSAAIAAHRLSAHGSVAVLDVDYHHGNGTQTIFYQRPDVLTASLHGHPRFAYPYFSGFADETGEGEGAGFNINVPLPEALDGERYADALESVLRRIRAFRPRFLVLALGLDTAKGDPTGSWSLSSRDFRRNGSMVGGLGLPTLVVQEGGYRIRSLGSNARNFFLGLWEGAFGVRPETATLDS
jgi:acetoin utilization deacetylase AcuC-like enzyme/GNAT superfamily N-acetyltransferase